MRLLQGVEPGELRRGDTLGFESHFHHPRGAFGLDPLDHLFQVEFFFHRQFYFPTIDANDSDRHGLAFLHEIRNFDVIIVAHLGDVHQALDTVLDLHERPERLHGLHHAVYLLAFLDVFQLAHGRLRLLFLCLALLELRLAFLFLFQVRSHVFR